ncbi:MMPL family transporter [Glutamicibacter sp. MNS18]|uniref:MMPL family transporter n=1 Tax=Glutamicibacter sp. MNS18 TaxID=2989817 RepID=UPI0022359DBB|nr:MMPL family transporter [Glutamicibacter sp. MNS18]MCW4467046.1 MMPL family transporter [Glutamicibacter sp. MNS18]
MRSSVLTTLAGTLTSRRGARGWVLGFLLLITLAFGLLSSLPAASHSPDPLPEDSESAQVAALLEGFEGSGRSTAVAVASRTDHQELTAADTGLLAEAGAVAGAVGPVQAGEPILSEDREAALITLSWDSVDPLADRDQVRMLRAELSQLAGDGLVLQVTGGAAFGADVADAFAGADFTLLAVTVGIVAVLLILTYRSPILWLIPLLVVAVADRAASLVTGALAGVWELHFDTGVLSVLVFGAGTNYALLLISRYRDELRRSPDHRQAMATAWRASFLAIATSNLTVVLALATLVLAVMDDTRGLGIACAIGLLVAAFFALFLLPAVLVLCGRKVFWPLVPTSGGPAARPGPWARIATGVTSRPAMSLGVVGAILLIFATVLTSTSLGVKPSEQFRGTMESAQGGELLAGHFPIGEVYPATVLSRSGAAEQVAEAAAAVPGIERVSVLGTSADGSWQRLMVAGSAELGSAAGRAETVALREAVSAVPAAEALVGGQGAQAYDTHRGHLGDFVLIAPLVLGICFVMLLLLTRSWLTAGLLALVNLLSSAAALGLGALIGSLVFDTRALDVQVPLLAFLFLVALGVDYTIFLAHRIRQEAAGQPMRQAVVNAVNATGAVITSAGLVLAGVFAALATLPLLVLGQLGLIVGLGVLLDTFLVRTVLVPALFTLLARRGIPAWSRPRPEADDETGHRQPAGIATR